MSDFLLPDIGNVTATAILGWYAWHTASRTIPELVAAFREELANTRTECRVERETLRDELNAERLERHSDHMAIVEALHELAERLRTPDTDSQLSGAANHTTTANHATAPTHERRIER